MATSRAAPGQAAFVLHRYDWSESSVIVELFTRAAGRVAVVARGAKKPTSNFRALLLPFAPLNVALGRPPSGDSEFATLRSAEWAGGTATQASMSGFYLNELLLKLLPRGDAHPALFDAYADTLPALPFDEAGALRAFELVLLRELGWLPDLGTATLTGAAVAEQARYALDAETGLVAADARGLPGAAWRALNEAMPDVAALRAAPGDLAPLRAVPGDLAPLRAVPGDLAPLRAACAPVAVALREPLRGLLHYHLGDRELRTRRVWQGVQRLARQAA